MTWDCAKCNPLNDRRDPRDVHVHIVTEQAWRKRPHTFWAPTPDGFITSAELMEVLNNPGRYDGKEFVLVGD